MTTTKKKTEVTKAKESPLVVVPDFMKKDAGKGTENLSAADLEIPRLQLLQSLSPQVVSGEERPGTFYHTILEGAIGKKGLPLRVVPIHADIKFMLWRPRHEGGGILARAELGEGGEYYWNPADTEFDVKPYKDRPTVVKWATKNTVSESGLDKFGSMDPADPNSQPAAVKMWNFVVVLPDHPHLGPMVLTFQRGQAKTGANFSSKVKFADGVPSFGQIFGMSAKLDNTGAGDFFNVGLTRIGYVEDEEQYSAYRALYENFKSAGVQIKDLEGTQDEGGKGTKGKTATPKGGIDV